MLNPAVRSLARRARSLRIPIKIMAGTGDQVVDAKHSATLHHHLPGSSIELLPLQGHMLHHTARARVIRAIEQICYPDVNKAGDAATL
jgi:pimeloyl-ACP methyl ester carboxylesterase